MATTSSILLLLLSVVLILIGITGTILPAIPGVPLVFAGLLLQAWTDDFQRVGWLILSTLGVMTVITILVDFAASALGAKRVGASTLALVGAAFGSIVGIFFGPLGIIFGPFVGAAAGELYAKPDLLQAGKVGLATWLGILIGTVVKVGLVFAMIMLYLTAYIF